MDESDPCEPVCVKRKCQYPKTDVREIKYERGKFN